MKISFEDKEHNINALNFDDFIRGAKRLNHETSKDDDLEIEWPPHSYKILQEFKGDKERYLGVKHTIRDR